MEKNNKSMNTIYDDSVSSGAILKDVKKKLGKRMNIDIDSISIEEKANTVINNLNSESKNIENIKITKKSNKVVSQKNDNQNKKVIKVTNKNKKQLVTSVNKPRKNSIFENEKLKIIPLGGLQEIGKNLTVFEYANEMIIVDCGVAFPEEDMLYSQHHHE